MTSAAAAPTTAAEIHAYALAAARTYVADFPIWRLANITECGRPDADTTGADALDSARRTALEAIDKYTPTDPHEAAEWFADVADCDEVSDYVWESVDSYGVLIYTARTREAFHELNGWDEDVSEFGPIEDLDKSAQVAVFNVLRRAALALVQEFAEDYAAEVAALGGLPEDDEDDAQN